MSHLCPFLAGALAVDCRSRCTSLSGARRASRCHFRACAFLGPRSSATSNGIASGVFSFSCFAAIIGLIALAARHFWEAIRQGEDG